MATWNEFETDAPDIAAAGIAVNKRADRVTEFFFASSLLMATGMVI